MEFTGTLFPGFRTPGGAQSFRGIVQLVLANLTMQGSHLAESVSHDAENVPYKTAWGRFVPDVPGVDTPGSLIGGGNIGLTQPGWFPSPTWWRPYASTNWDAVRASGIGYGLWMQHQQSNAVPIAKLVSPGSGFVLPNTFLGQPFGNSTPLLGQPR